MAKKRARSQIATWTPNVATLTLGSRPRLRGLQGCGPRGRKPGNQGKGIVRVKARGSSRVTSHTPESLESVREYEGVNPHTPKATPTLGDGVPVDSQNFREQLQGSKLNGLFRSLYH